MTGHLDTLGLSLLFNLCKPRLDLGMESLVLILDSDELSSSGKRIRGYELLRDLIGLDHEIVYAGSHSASADGHRTAHGHTTRRWRSRTDRSAAEALRGYLVQVPIEEALPLENGEFYEHQILNLEVWAVSGEFYGLVQEIVHTGANEVYVVRHSDRPSEELLIPAIKEVILDVDLKAGRLVVDLPEGLI